MNKNILFLTTGILFLLSGASIIGVLLLKDSKEIFSYSSSKPDTVYPANSSTNAQPSTTSNLQVQGVSSPNKNNSQLPTPDLFEVYEEYANNDSSLYIDIVVGTGSQAEPGDKVAMLYKGWLTNGQVFDQSRLNEDGQLVAFPFQIGAGQVIPGWEQTITGMKEGGKRRLIIPPAFGYGPSGQGSIPANAILIFDVELLRVDKN